MKEMITVEKEVYEAVLRNSVRVNDLEAEKQRLREMVLNDVTMERAYKLREENQQLKELLHSLKCCLTSENIEPQIRVEKSLAKIEEFLTDGK